MNMNMRSRTEKVLMSLIVTKILLRIKRKLYQLRASLKTRSKRTPRKADRAAVGESADSV